MENSVFFILISLLWFATSVKCYGGKYFNPLNFMMGELSEERLHGDSENTAADFFDKSQGYSLVYIGPQDGLKERDKIKSLPGQPGGVDFDQYSGYVTVDPNAGRALFYYFVESPQNSCHKPLVLWLTGAPGCSSFGNGAMMELGPFRVNSDGKTLHRNHYAWNIDANIIFLESPVGVGFSYTNSSSDYALIGDSSTARDTYAFMANWLERFPEYKSRKFFITGENYAGHFAPQLAQEILYNNRHTNLTKFNLKGIAIGNPHIDFATALRGFVDYYWTHAFMSDEVYSELVSHCDLYDGKLSHFCWELFDQATDAFGYIYPLNIYTRSCNVSLNSSSFLASDPCSPNYIQTYLNIPQVQKALHANVTGINYPWESCSGKFIGRWKDSLKTVLPIIQELMSEGIRMWIYSGDTDGGLPITGTRYAINKLGTPVRTPWYPWYAGGEVGGYAVGYQNLTFVTVRGSGHFVPSFQPARALVLFSSFIQGKLPPSA